MTEQKLDNPPAFPATYMVKHHGNGVINKAAVSEGGMTLRDYFAAAALQGLLASQDAERLGNFYNDGGAAHAAKLAGKFADAMLKERAKHD